MGTHSSGVEAYSGHTPVIIFYVSHILVQLSKILSFPSRCFILFSLAISPLRFGRPGDGPVSLRGQGELARAGIL